MSTCRLQKSEPDHEECAICGYNFVHPVEFACLPAGKSGGLVSITAFGIHRQPLAPPIGRGVRLEITFLCENGHKYKRSWQFEKGNTLTWVTCLCQAEFDASTIWRD